ncbi:MAG TPA: hypothetical protein VEY33_09595 [Gemmatimonadota bacterium]|nr:hypothetical protein [Gemmatimonadota bacterium]
MKGLSALREVAARTVPSSQALFGIALATLCGFTVVLFSMSTNSVAAFLRSASVALLVAGALALVGALLGFLFGIPRALQAGETPVGQTRGTGQGASSTSQNVTYGANTNLEQISDWLTKILVGVGLTQLNDLPDGLQDLAGFLSPGLGVVPRSEVLATAIVLYFSICGFLFGYLWTRLFLAGALREADVAALGKKISELEKQVSQDARALSLVQQNLNTHADSPEVSEDELREAIIAASQAAKTTIFYQASDVRNRNCRDSERKPRMERTIPIFRALVASDDRDEYHMSHGQLGFALMDKRTPDWTQAERELTKAIEIRGNWQIHDSLYYEFHRAICRIELEDQTPGMPLEPVLRDGILADLKAAANIDELLEIIKQEETVRNWMSRNQISIEELRRLSP